MTTICSSSKLLIFVILLEQEFMSFTRLMLTNCDSITNAEFNAGFQGIHALWRQNSVTVETHIVLTFIRLQSWAAFMCR